MQNACDNKRKKEKIYKSFEPEILQAEFALKEIEELYKKKEKEKEIELARIEQEEAQKREEIVVKKRTLKDIIRRAWNKKDNK
jgi:DNA-binding transcriptional MerR regulator